MKMDPESMLEEFRRKADESFLNGIAGRLFEPEEVSFDDMCCCECCIDDDPNEKYQELKVHCARYVYNDKMRNLIDKIVKQEKLCKICVNIYKKDEEKYSLVIEFWPDPNGLDKWSRPDKDLIEHIINIFRDEYPHVLYKISQ